MKDQNGIFDHALQLTAKSEIGLIELMAIALIGMWATGFVLFKLGFFTSENDFRFKNSFLRKIDIDRDSDGKA